MSLTVVPHRPPNRASFNVAIVCALSVEAQAVLDVFDVNWTEQGYQSGRAPEDQNEYTLGLIGSHPVVLAHIPGIGVTTAAMVANNVRHSFPNIQLALVVGICGGVPSSPLHPQAVYLGDLIISTSLVHYDFGRQYPAGFVRREMTGSGLGRPSHRIRSFLAKLETQPYCHRIADRIEADVKQMCAQAVGVQYPGRDLDLLYEATYLHKHRQSISGVSCEECMRHPDQICEIATRTVCASLGCEPERLICHRAGSQNLTAPAHSTHRPSLHFGSIGSGNGVIKSGQHRDQMAARDGIIAFEMEGAGTWDCLPSIVVKSVCDYADSHKSKAWQIYAATVAAAGAKAILDVWEASEPAHEAEIALSRGSEHPGWKAHWHVPFARDQDFIPRDHILDQISHCLTNVEYSPRAVLSGLGGVGKSQLAIEYAYKQRENAAEVSVFWIHASSRTRLQTSYQTIVQELRLPGFNDTKVDPTEIFYRWLQNHSSGPWLLILDNVDDAELLSPSCNGEELDASIVRYIPQRAGGAVLITSRDRSVAVKLASRPEHVISVSTMSLDEACQLATTKIPNERGSDVDRATLVHVLDYLPLAISQAAAYITRGQRMTIVRYIEVFNGRESDQLRILAQEGIDLRRDWQVPHSVVRSWEISFVQIQKYNALAVELLSLIAVFDRQNIPEFLLQGDHNSVDFEDAIEVLSGYALIQSDEAKSSVSAHRLVQLATIAWITKVGSWPQTRKKALLLLDRYYPTSRYETWATCQALEAHAERAIRTEHAAADVSLMVASISHKRSCYFAQKGLYQAALKLAQDSTQQRSQILGSDHILTLDSMHILGTALLHQGQFEAAEQICQQTLRARERVLGAEHPHTLMTMNKFAEALYYQGLYEAAEETARETLVKREKVLGLDHSDTLTTMSTLADVLQARGQYQAAEDIVRQTLLVRKRVLGVDHPNTIISATSLASVLQDQAQYEVAEQMYRQLLTTSERVLGAQHPDTLTILGSLAGVLDARGQWAAAEQLFREVLTMSKDVLGAEHPSSLIFTNHLSLVLIAQGQYHEAEQLYRQIVAMSEKELGIEHPSTLHYMNNLAISLYWQQQYDTAEDLYCQVLVARRKILGPEHPSSLITMAGLANVLCEQGRPRAAEDMYRQTIEFQDKVLGPTHPNTLSTVKNLASVLVGSGRYEEAKEVYQQMMITLRKALGAEHPETQACQQRLDQIEATLSSEELD